MRVLFDTNVFISYLLTSSGGSAVNGIVDAAFAEMFTLLVSDALLFELSQKVVNKKYLSQRISEDMLEEFVSILVEVAEIVPEIQEELPAIGRDRKDDYVIAYSVVGEADYLVTGDNDLLTLSQIEGVKILRPADFEQVLKQSIG